jgi:Domain of unknown function (DUF4844)
MWTALKIVLGVVIFLVATYLAIVAGLLFELWPTTLDDHELKVTSEQIEQLRVLRMHRKFIYEPGTLYSDAPNELERARAELPLNQLLDRLVVDLPQNPRKSFVMSAFKDALRQFNGFDTEEQERMGRYLVEIMDILGIESSNKLISVWRYRLPL